MKFRLSKYIFPAVVSMVLVGAYTNIDGLFIGAAAGDDGIAAINIVWPIVALITALGTGIGTGGSIVACNRRGAGDVAGARRARRTSVALLAAGGIAAAPVLFFAGRFFLRQMGADGQVLRYAENYALVVTFGAVFQVMGAGLVVLLRSDGKTYAAMAATAAGLAVHVLLDWLLVGKYVLYGVAFSTVAAQAVVMAASLCCFCARRKGEERDADLGQTAAGVRTSAHVGEILRQSAAPIGVNFVSSVVLLITNFFAQRTGGTAALSAYGVMSYAFFTFDYVFQGVCDGVQPVISYTDGAGDRAEKRRAVRCGVLLLAALSLSFAAMTPLLILLLPRAFAVSAEAEAFMRAGLVLYAFSYPLKAAVKWVCAYAYSQRRGWIANVCIVADPLLFTPLFLCLLPPRLGTDGLWAALPLTQAAVLLVGIVLTLAVGRRNKGGLYVSG